MNPFFLFFSNENILFPFGRVRKIIASVNNYAVRQFTDKSYSGRVATCPPGNTEQRFPRPRVLGCTNNNLLLITVGLKKQDSAAE